MRKDKQLAIQLRKDGKSYQEIAGILNISKSTLSGWFSKETWSLQTKERLTKLARNNASKRMTIISHKRRAALQENYKNKRLEAKNQFNHFIKDRLFVAGLMIYWGEGDSKLINGIIRATNSDPLMIKLFYKFVKKYLPEISDKAKIYLVLYPDLDDMVCRKHWSQIIELPLSRFIKSSVIKGKHPSKRLAYGIGTLAINSRAYKEKIITWINLIKINNL